MILFWWIDFDLITWENSALLLVDNQRDASVLRDFALLIVRKELHFTGIFILSLLHVFVIFLQAFILVYEFRS